MVSNGIGGSMVARTLRRTSGVGTVLAVLMTLGLCMGLTQVGCCAILGNCPPACTTNAGCNDNNGCTTDTCNTTTGACTNTKLCEDALCVNKVCVQCVEDTDCNTGQTCDTATHTCSGCGADADCNDNDACTTDTCDVAAGTCSNDPVTDCCTADSDCDDTDVCTTDACTNNACTHDAVTGCCSTDADCDDGDACTTDACGTDNTCSNDPVACAADETCVDGVCAKNCTADADCDDSDPCTTDTCNATTGTCTHSDACDDGVACTDDTCDAAGACTHASNCATGETCNTTTGVCDTGTACTVDGDCDDNNPCTDDTCTAGVCGSTNNTAPCSDGNACTVNDVCAAGACTAGTAITCPSGQSCVPASGNCAAIACTSDANCNDNKSCTTDICNLLTGLCEYTKNNNACNTGKFCDGTWTCDPDNTKADTRGCVSTGDPCIAAPNATYQPCDEAANACVACTASSQCNDAIPCTNDTCNTGTGLCTNTTVDTNCPNPKKCDGPDTCDPTDTKADASGCVPTVNPCAPRVCDEATFVVGDLNTCKDCTGNADCNDGVTCTKDECNIIGAGQCSHTDTNTLCPNTSFCNGVDVCDPNNADADSAGCVSGLAAAGGPTYPCGGVTGACNENTNACFACTGNADCSDNVACTTDTCNGGTGGCTHTVNCTAGNGCNFTTGACEASCTSNGQCPAATPLCVLGVCQ